MNSSSYYNALKALLLLLLCTCFLVCCQKGSSGPSYVITYKGTLLTDSTISFSVNAPAGSSVIWDFGDGNANYGNWPAYGDYYYYHGGTYTVRAIVNNDSAHIATTKITIAYSVPKPTITVPDGSFLFHHFYSFTVYPHPPNDTTIYYPDTLLNLTNIDGYTVAIGTDTL